jgi:formylmethanofuran dehydrogenase subunit B
LLERRESDLCVLVGTETIPYFSPAARQHLNHIPTIVLDYPNAPLHLNPDVQFSTAAYGLHTAGTAYRMDNVPLPLKSVCRNHLPTDDFLLTELASRCQAGM